MQNITTLNRTTEKTKTLTGADATASRPWLQDFWLWILLVGPLVAPFFVALGLPVLKPFADAIYLLGETVCPKVDVHMMFLGEPVAVCFSCWAAVFGLWTVRLLYGRAGEGFGPFRASGVRGFWAKWGLASSNTKLAVLLVGFIPWALDVALWDAGIWSSPQLFMAFAGYMGGLTAGSILLPAASAMRSRTVR